MNTIYRFLLTIALLVTVLINANAQIEHTETSLTGVFNVIASAAVPPSEAIIQGFFVDQTGQYVDTDVTTGDVLWDRNGNRWEIVSVLVNNNPMTIRVTQPTPANSLTEPVVGRGAIIREGDKYPPYIAGIDSRLNNIIQTHTMINIDQALSAGTTVQTGVTIQGDGTVGNPLDLNSAGAVYNDVWKWNGTNWVLGQDNDIQSLVVTNAGTLRNISISNGNTITFDIADNDNDPTNEYQNLAISGNLLSITNGNAVTIPGNDNWGTQTALVGSTLTGDGTLGNPLDIAQQGATVGQVLKWNGTSWVPDVDVSGGTVTTDITLQGDGTAGNPLGIAQQGATANQVLKWNGTAWVPQNDSDAQTLTVNTVGTTNTITISNGNSITVDVADNDNDPNNEIQDIVTDGTSGNISITSGSSLTLNVDDADADPNNELQTLSIVGDQLTISSGNTVTVPGNDDWGTQVAQTDATLTGDGTTLNPLSIAQQGATNGQVLKWNGTTWAPANDNTGAGGGMNSFNWTDGTTTNTITDGTTIGVVGSTEGIDATMTGNNVEVSLDLSEVPTTTTVDNTFDFVGWNSTVASEQRINQADVLSWINSNVTGDNWGTQVVQTDASLTGDGTTTTPLGLSVNSINDTYMDYTQVTLSDFTNDAGFVTSNLYTANGTLSGNRTVDMGSFGLTFQGPSYPTVTIQSTGTTGGVLKFNGSQAGNFQIYGHSGGFFGWSSITNKDVFRYSPATDNFDFQCNASFDFQIKDGNNDPGTAGEILSTTGTATDWISPSTLALGSIDQHSDVDVTTTPPTTNQVLAWNGTNWVPAETRDEITVVTDYTQLAGTTVRDSFLFITHPAYGGLFYLYTGAEAVDNGIVVQDQTGTKFKRVREDDTYYKLCWWDETTLTGSEILQRIFQREPDGGIKVDVSRYDSPRTIILDRDVDLVPDLELYGRNDTLRREATPVTTLTAAVTTADNILNVGSSAGFKVNQNVFITYAGPNSRADGNNWGIPKRITAIPSATQIQIQGTAPAAASVGDTVFVVTTMFLNGNALTLNRIHFHDLAIDGNWTNNPYTNDWGVNNTIRMANHSGSYFRFDRMTFMDTPSENVIVGSMTAEDIQAEDLAGSIFHCSVVMDTAVVFKVYNTWGNNICQATDAVTGHSEAAFVTSASPYNMHLENVEVYNCKEAFIGDIGPSASGMEIINCKAVNCKTVLFGNITTGAMERLNVIGNDFIDCNYFGWTGGALKSGRYVKNPTISNNRFIGTFLNFDGVKHLEFTGNTIAAEDLAGTVLTNNWTNFGDTLTYDAALYLAEFQDVVIANNNFSMDNRNTDLLRVAIMVDAAGVTSNTNPDFIIAKDLLIQNNNFGGFVQSIMCNPYDPIIPQAPSREVINWVISNNVVSIKDDYTSANKVGIMGLPGTLITHNTVYAASDTLTGTQYPIIGYGVHGTASNPRQQRLMGATVTHNKVYGIGKADGSSISIFVGGNVAGTNHGRYNVTCKDNISFSDVQGNGTDIGNGYITNNVNYTNTLTNMTARQNPPHDEDY